MIGLFSRLAERRPDGAHFGYQDVRELALAAERTGFDSFWVPDHLVFRRPNAPDLGCWESLTFLGALAAHTTTIRLGTFVAASPFRNPALLAKMAASLDEISNGRFTLGLGAGNWAEELRAFGYPTDRRVSRFAEAIEIVATLLREGEVSFEGEHHSADRAVVGPRGPSPAGPRLWIGASGDRMLRLAARHADGLITIWPTTVDQVAAARQRLLAACDDVARDPEELELAVGTHVQLGGEDEPPDPARSISGSDDEIAQRLRDLTSAGADHIVIDIDPDITVDRIERLGAIVRASRA